MIKQHNLNFNIPWKQKDLKKKKKIKLKKI